MGYTTDFQGEFTLAQTLTREQQAYLIAFSGSRRMKRDPEKTAKMEDPLRVAVGLPVGLDGAYYVGASESNYGQDRTDDIVDYNDPPGYTARYEFEGKKPPAKAAPGETLDERQRQPGLWCQWEPTEDGTAIAWNEAEKFYNYIEWIEYIIENFLKRWGHVLNGTVEWQGEDSEDFGKIVIKDNVVKILKGRKTFSEEG